MAVASILGIAAEPGLAAYSAAKAALISLCQSINGEESSAGGIICAGSIRSCTQALISVST